MREAAGILRAIDLYSGVGGWALGLRLVGVEVVASYERWGIANETNFKNNRHQAQTVDIRRLDVNELPANIDIVVGSPPCTQFSFSNRGGRGDIDDGLRDIIKFLEIVDHVKPKVWAMENVPRVAQIIKAELMPKGRLRRFKHLGIVPHIVNMADFGVPQKRTRCIAGNFDFDLLSSYMPKIPRRTLGQIIQALAAESIVDPIYGLRLDRQKLTDHVKEAALSPEEVRINKAAKVTHPVYNAMSFPDRLDRPVRTITATCTRVSRESIVIEDPKKIGVYRRLTIRERASLQGFPITFQFYGETYGQRQQMVGNAIPPVFAFYLAQSLLGVKANQLLALQEAAVSLECPSPMPSDAKPDRSGFKYSANRKFRFAIPSLHLKSGVRFELVNGTGSPPEWKVNFYFGTSKSIHSLGLRSSLCTLLLSKLSKEILQSARSELDALDAFIADADVTHMQAIWSHRGVGCTTPFMVLDKLDEIGANLARVFSEHEVLAQELVGDAVLEEYGQKAMGLPGLVKLARNAPPILAGILVGATANDALIRKTQCPSAAPTARAVG
ncbi:DNA (cytosine-5-)-methyltransferase [Ralstonia sp. CHL-2022]|uniref:Cytosine-specific methyltransferase n=1 Tax=Ralstonia mojiangensis TaxID=2953895 RepID=A0AAE3HZJ5_9RALS|nr:DNA (cytosine-5-)-methyltransferase [Ralstonia mojiangensis]MCT7314893.1 DNA (cytosine-5-)-methyltransferase [Ralstonia mojiangensis]